MRLTAYGPAALIAYCRRYKVPLVTTGGAGGNRPDADSGSRSGETIQDPLAAKLRERLKSQFRGDQEQQR